MQFTNNRAIDPVLACKRSACADEVAAALTQMRSGNVSSITTAMHLLFGDDERLSIIELAPCMEHIFNSTIDLLSDADFPCTLQLLQHYSKTFSRLSETRQLMGQSQDRRFMGFTDAHKTVIATQVDLNQALLRHFDHVADAAYREEHAVKVAALDLMATLTRNIEQIAPILEHLYHHEADAAMRLHIMQTLMTVARSTRGFNSSRAANFGNPFAVLDEVEARRYFAGTVLETDPDPQLRTYAAILMLMCSPVEVSNRMLETLIAAVRPVDGVFNLDYLSRILPRLVRLPLEQQLAIINQPDFDVDTLQNLYLHMLKYRGYIPMDKTLQQINSTLNRAVSRGAVRRKTSVPRNAVLLVMIAASSDTFWEKPSQLIWHAFQIDYDRAALWKMLHRQLRTSSQYLK